MLRTDIGAGILTLTFDRPDAKNALNTEIVGALIDALNSAAGDDRVRVAVLTGAPPMFTSGMDVNVFQDPGNQDNARLLRYQVPEMFQSIIEFPKPLIVAVNGPGVGFGATIIGLADLSLMAESAKIMVPFSTLGIGPEACASYTLPRLMGWQAASWLLYSGEWMSARDCLATGLVREVTDDKQLLPTAMQRAELLASRSSVSLMAIKDAMRASQRDQLHEANRYEMQRFMELLDGPACAEGVGAFFEKRRPDFAARQL